MEKILVIGGAGYIGSHLVHLLKSLHYHPIILDNLSSGAKESVSNFDFFEGNTQDEILIERIYDQYGFSTVIHLAAFIQVSESVNDPLKYYANNVTECLPLLNVMKKLKIKNFLFSSSAAVYGNPDTEKIKETARKNPVTPYGKSKWMLEEILADCNHAFQLNVIALRYFNVAGSFAGVPAHRKQPSTHLIPLTLQAALGKTILPIYGNDYPTKDGCAIRDYVHIMDICLGHIKALELLLKNNCENLFSVFNLGSGEGHTVLEVVQMIEDITQQKITLKYEPRRKGDPSSLIADIELAYQALDWSPTHSKLNMIIEDAYHFEKKLHLSEHVAHAV